ncbi:hypothetical protein Ancab_004815 [Ancistrocladus abbreviatus]
MVPWLKHGVFSASSSSLWAYLIYGSRGLTECTQDIDFHLLYLTIFENWDIRFAQLLPNMVARFLRSNLFVRNMIEISRRLLFDFIVNVVTIETMIGFIVKHKLRFSFVKQF